MTSRPAAAALGVLVLALAAPCSAQVNPKNMNPIPNPRPGWQQPLAGSPVSRPGTAHRELWQLWETLPGRYRETGEGPRLEVTLRAVSPYVLFVEARSGAGGQQTVERGTIRLADVSTSSNSAKMRFALEYRPETHRQDFACTLFGAPGPGGVTFETEASDCSFPLGRRVSKLKLDASQGEIAIADEKSGEALSLRRVADR